MEAGSVGAVIADPPYGTGQYQRREVGMGKVPNATFSKADWDVWDTVWIDDARRISSGLVMFFLPVKEIASAVAYAESTGEPWRLMAWCKSDPMPMFTGQVSYGFEPVMVLRSKGAKGGRDWCEASSPKQAAGRDRRDHPHQKPLKVMRWLCEMTPPDALVFDPFGGSGTTAVACQKTGRRCLIVESDPQYIPVIERRVRDARTPLFDEIGA